MFWNGEADRSRNFFVFSNSVNEFRTPGRVQFSPRSSRKSSESYRSMKSFSSNKSSKSALRDTSVSPRSPRSEMETKRANSIVSNHT